MPATRASKRKRADTSGDAGPAPAPASSATKASSSKKSKTTSVASKAKPLGRNTSLTLGIPINHTKEPLDIPVDIFYEILSYFSSVPFDVLPMDGPWGSEFYFRESDALERSEALRTLSQISKSWRDFFLPLAWENIELATAGRKGVQWYNQTSENVLKAEKGFKKLTHVREFVRGIRVVLSKVSIDKTMPAFVNCLKLCPNITTVSIHFAHGSTGAAFKNAFQGLTFPAVTSLVLPTHAHNIVKSFPNVKKVFCTRGDGRQILKSLGPLGKQIELLAGMPGQTAWGEPIVDVQDLLKYVPNIAELRLNGFLPDVDAFRKLKNLRRLELTERPDGNDNREDENDSIPGIPEYDPEKDPYMDLTRVATVSERQMEMLKKLLDDCTVIVHASAFWHEELGKMVQAPSGRFYIPPREEN